MAAFHLILIQLFISLSLVVCNSIEKRSPPRPLLLEDPAGNYSLLNGSTTGGRSEEFLRRIRAGTYIPIGSNHTLAQFLVKSQHAIVCPDGKHCKMENSRELTFEPNLPEYGLFCTDKEWFSKEDKQLVIYTLQFRLIPGVCFTRYQHLSFCDKPKILFPTDSKCVTFFKGENCSGGEKTNIYSGGLDMLENAIVGSKSFAFC